MKQSLWTNIACLAVILSAAATPPVYGAAFIYYQEDFENGAAGFTIDNAFGNGNGLWHLSTACQSSLSGHTAATTLAYADNAVCNYVEGVTSQGVATSPTIMLYGSTYLPIKLKMKYFLQTENDPGNFDNASIEVSKNGGPFVAIAHNDSAAAPVTLTEGAGVWLEMTADLSAYAGSSVRLRFGFDTVDNVDNSNPGFYVDDIIILNVPCQFILYGDANSDCKVNLIDVALLAQNWLVDCYQTPTDSGCIPIY